MFYVPCIEMALDENRREMLCSDDDARINLLVKAKVFDVFFALSRDGATVHHS
jgi:hypothetical protein